MPTHNVAEVSHEVVRWSIDTQSSFDEFRARYEAVVPERDLDRLARLRAEHASWDAVLADAESSAPHGFLRFWSTDVGDSCASRAIAAPASATWWETTQSPNACTGTTRP